MKKKTQDEIKRFSILDREEQLHKTKTTHFGGETLKVTSARRRLWEMANAASRPWLHVSHLCGTSSQLMQWMGGQNMRDVCRVPTTLVVQESAAAPIDSPTLRPDPRPLLAPLNRMAADMFRGSMIKEFAAIRVT